MRPHRASIMDGAAARAIRNGPTTLVSITIRKIAGATSQKRVGTVRKVSLTYFIPRPALLTRTSSRPKRGTPLRRAARSRLRGSRRRSAERSACRRSAARPRPPPPRSRPALRAAETITRAPASASASAIARPRPRPPPVTMATRGTKGHGSISERSQAASSRREQIFDAVERIDRETVEEAQELRSGLLYPVLRHAGNKHGAARTSPRIPCRSASPRPRRRTRNRFPAARGDAGRASRRAKDRRRRR